MSVTFAHVGGIPIEEMLAFTPALLLASGAAFATLRARLSAARSPASHDVPSGRAARAGCRR